MPTGCLTQLPAVPERWPRAYPGASVCTCGSRNAGGQSRARPASPSSCGGAPAKPGARQCQGIRAFQLVCEPWSSSGFTGMTSTADISSQYLHWISVPARRCGLAGTLLQAADPAWRELGLGASSLPLCHPAGTGTGSSLLHLRQRRVSPTASPTMRLPELL